MGSKTGQSTSSNTMDFSNKNYSGSSSGVSSQTPDPLAKLAYLQTLKNAAQISNTPYQPYGGQLVAGFNKDQLAAQQGFRDLQGYLQPYVDKAMALANKGVEERNRYYGLAEGLTNKAVDYSNPENYFTNFGRYYDVYGNKTSPYTSAADRYSGAADPYGQRVYDISRMENFNQQALNRYMNPYQQSVIDATLANMKQNQDVLQNQNTARAVQQGAYGGSGQFMGQAELGRQQALANAQTLAQLNAQNYNQAMQQYNQQQGVAMTGAQQAFGNQMTQAAFQMKQAEFQKALVDAANAQSNEQQQMAIKAAMDAAQQLSTMGGNYLTGNLQAGQGMVGFGESGERGKLSELGALAQSGALQQALAQKQIEAAYNQWQQAQAFPYQQTAYFANLAQGVGPLMGQYGTTAANQQGTESGINIGQKQTKTSGGGGGIAGALTTGLGLLSALKDGGVVKNRAVGGYMEHVGDAPYGGSSINMKAGLGPLMQKIPYSEALDYISDAEKTSKVMTPAKQLGAEKLQSEINKALGLISKGSKTSIGLSSDDETVSDGGGEDTRGLVKKISGLVSKAGKNFNFNPETALDSYLPDFGGSEASPSTADTSAAAGGEGLDFGSLFSGLYSQGGAVHRADGGSFAEQYAQSKKAQQQAQDILQNYQDILGRKPNQKEFDYLSDQTARGMTPAARENYLRSSSEYAQTKGHPVPPSAEDGSYEGLLARAHAFSPGVQLSPEQQGMPSMPSSDYYTQKRPVYEGVGGGNLNLAGSMDVPTGANATPQQTEFLKKVYANYLGREASPEDIQLQLAQIQKGVSPADIEKGVMLSPEAKNTAYIQKMYGDMLGRKADLGGLGFWKQMLSQGLAAPDLSSEFEKTPEYANTPVIFRSNAPVQGYFSQISDGYVNPDTGLFNLKYTAPYRGSTPTYDLSSGESASDDLNKRILTKLTSQLPQTSANGGRISKANGGGLSGKNLYDYFISMGANPKEAAMLTGNAKVESSFNPYAMHDRNTGYGLWGHGKDRWIDMQKFTGERKPGWEEQAKFALWELRNSPKASLARQTLAKANSPQEVAIAGMHYERPQGYSPSTPWAGKNWAQRYSNVASLMGGKDIGAGSVLARINPKDPSGPLLDIPTGAPAVTDTPRRLGLLPRLIRALAPISTAEAAESQPSAKAEEKPMFAWPTFRNPRMNNLPDALGWGQQAALPEWKKEVQTGFGPLQGEKPADEAQLLAEPRRHAAMGPEMEVPLPPRRPTDGVLAADREKSGKKYWGDWRDAEPWASDPIGGFFDTLTGEEKRSDKPGKYEPESGFDIGSLFGFSNGGSVRQAYANGGGEEEFTNPLEELGSAIEEGFGGLFGDNEAPLKMPAQQKTPETKNGLGDLLGGLFGGEETPKGITASDRAPAAAASAPQRGLLPPAVSQALIAAGLGMMASPRSNPFEALGQGGLQGFQVYTELADQERKREEAAAQQRAAQVYSEKLSEPPVAEDAEDATVKSDAEALAPTTSRLDALVKEMDRVAAVPATTPQQVQQKNAALRMLQTRISIAEKMEERSTGKIGTIGKDEFGNAITGYITGPNAGKSIDEVRRTGAKKEETPESTGGIDWSKTGEEFLSTLPVDLQDEIKGIAEGRLDIPKGPKAQGVWKAVTRYSPGFDMSVYGARKKMRDSYADQTGTKPGAQITAGNTAIGHAGELSDLILKLNNYDTDILNKPLNYVKERWGGEAAQTLNKYRSLVDKYVDEQTSFYKGRGGGGIEERKEARERLDPSKGTKVLLDTLRGDQEAMGSKVSELEEAWNKTMGKGQSAPFENYDVISKHGKEGKALLEHNYKVATGETKPVRTGRTKDGRKVTEYSDGYRKYGE